MEKQYSFKKGLGKAVETILTAAIAIAIFSSVADIDLWVLAEQYLKPLLSGVTVAGALRLALNFIKVKLA